MDAVAEANRQFELQRLSFIYGELKTEFLESFRNAKQAHIFSEEGDECHYASIELNDDSPIYDDKASCSFKVGDKFVCQIRETAKEKWFQIAHNRKFINLRDPRQQFKRVLDNAAECYIFVKLTGISIVMLTQEIIDFRNARKTLGKVSKSIISYDQYGQASVKPGVK